MQSRLVTCKADLSIGQMLAFPCLGILPHPLSRYWHIHSHDKVSQPSLYFLLAYCTQSKKYMVGRPTNILLGFYMLVLPEVFHHSLCLYELLT